ncbi:MAG: discoidin domain-containing protein, partial [bacterium]
MQIDLSTVQDVSGLVTQGRGDGGWWVKGYAVRVSDDGESWKEVACGRIFDANSDMNTKVINMFPAPVKGRYVRIYPM